MAGAGESLAAADIGRGWTRRGGARRRRNGPGGGPAVGSGPAVWRGRAVGDGASAGRGRTSDGRPARSRAPAWGTWPSNPDWTVRRAVRPSCHRRGFRLERTREAGMLTTRTVASRRRTPCEWVTRPAHDERNRQGDSTAAGIVVAVLSAPVAIWPDPRGRRRRATPNGGTHRHRGTVSARLAAAATVPPRAQCRDRLRLPQHAAAVEPHPPHRSAGRPARSVDLRARHRDPLSGERSHRRRLVRPLRRLRRTQRDGPPGLHRADRPRDRASVRRDEEPRRHRQQTSGWAGRGAGRYRPRRSPGRWTMRNS